MSGWKMMKKGIWRAKKYCCKCKRVHYLATYCSICGFPLIVRAARPVKSHQYGWWPFRTTFDWEVIT